MTGINHAVSGAVIAALIPEAAIAVPLALLSHFALDSLPHLGIHNHTGKTFHRVLSGDSFLVFVFLLILVIWQPHHWVLLLICAILAISPDLMWLPNYIREQHGKPLGKFNLIMRFHKRIQWGERSWGYLTELPWLGVMLTCLILLEH